MQPFDIVVWGSQDARLEWGWAVPCPHPLEPALATCRPRLRMYDTNKTSTINTQNTAALYTRYNAITGPSVGRWTGPRSACIFVLSLFKYYNIIHTHHIIQYIILYTLHERRITITVYSSNEWWNKHGDGTRDDIQSRLLTQCCSFCHIGVFLLPHTTGDQRWAKTAHPYKIGPFTPLIFRH